MSKFSFLSWNVRHFKGSAARLADVEAMIKDLDPDVFGLIEYQGKKAIRELIVNRFPKYNFAVTDSTGNLEVVVAFRRKKFKQVVWTQRRTFNDVKRRLRPGALISLRFGEEFYSLLYLHTDSGTKATDYKNRMKVWNKVWKLRQALENRSASNKSNLIVLGDLNTMGKRSTISGATEIKKIEKSARNNHMVLLEKDRTTTWSQWGKEPRGKNRRKLKVSELSNLMTSNLDHVIADEDLEFVAHGDNDEPIHVHGWHQVSGTDKTRFLWDISDHCALFGEVW